MYASTVSSNLTLSASFKEGSDIDHIAGSPYIPEDSQFISSNPDLLDAEQKNVYKSGLSYNIINEFYLPTQDSFGLNIFQ